MCNATNFIRKCIIIIAMFSYTSEAQYTNQEELFERAWEAARNAQFEESISWPYTIDYLKYARFEAGKDLDTAFRGPGWVFVEKAQSLQNLNKWELFEAKFIAAGPVPSGLFDLDAEIVKSGRIPDFDSYYRVGYELTSGPLLVIKGKNPVQLKEGEHYVESIHGGHYANGTGGENLTNSVEIDYPNFIPGPNNVIEYKVKDSSTNLFAHNNRQVIVAAPSIPKITLFPPSNLQIPYGSSWADLDPGYRAYDSKDGDLTDDVVAIPETINTFQLGTTTILYQVTDPDGNKSPFVPRTVTVVDEVSPVLRLERTIPVYIEASRNGAPWSDHRVIAIDNVDGDISDSVVANPQTVPTNQLRPHTITYSVSDSSFNQATPITQTVYIEDNTDPIIQMNLAAGGQVDVEINIEEPYFDPGATATDNFDDFLPPVRTSGLPTNTLYAGTHTIRYDVQDWSGNPALPKERRLTIVDNINPVIHVTRTIELPLGGSYNPEYSVTDRGDPNILSRHVDIDRGNLDTNRIDSYDVHFTVVDASGNPGEAIQTVNVIDLTGPEIFLIGPDEYSQHVGSGVWTDPGAWAIDDVDGVVEAYPLNVVYTDIPLIGQEITYVAYDRSGNESTKTRIINTYAFYCDNVGELSWYNDFLLKDFVSDATRSFIYRADHKDPVNPFQRPDGYRCQHAVPEPRANTYCRQIDPNNWTAKAFKLARVKDGTILPGDQFWDDYPTADRCRSTIASKQSEYYCRHEQQGFRSQYAIASLKTGETLGQYDFNDEPSATYCKKVLPALGQKVFCRLTNDVNRMWQLANVDNGTILSDVYRPYGNDSLDMCLADVPDRRSSPYYCKYHYSSYGSTWKIHRINNGTEYKAREYDDSHTCNTALNTFLEIEKFYY